MNFQQQENENYIRLLRRSDISSINVKDLANELGMSVSTIYYQHGSRQELLRFIANKCSNQVVTSSLVRFQMYRTDNLDSKDETIFLKGVSDFFTEYNKLMPGAILHLTENDRDAVQTYLEQFRSLCISWIRTLPDGGRNALLWFNILWDQIDLAKENGTEEHVPRSVGS